MINAAASSSLKRAPAGDLLTIVTVKLCLMDESIPAAVADNPDIARAVPETIEVVTGEDPQHSVIWLHGLSADGNDFVPVVPQLDLSPGPAVRFIFPHAPVRPVTLNGGMPMRAWYDIRSLSSSRDTDEEGVLQARDMVHALIANEQARGVQTRNIILAGVSQGGAIATYVALRFHEPLAGLITLSSYLLFSSRLAAEKHAANDKLPVFLAHGTTDPVVPFQAGQGIREALKPFDYPVTWRQYNMPHSVCNEEINDIGQWMRAVIV